MLESICGWFDGFKKSEDKAPSEKKQNAAAENQQLRQVLGENYE